jgi:hypothetical protein
MESEVRSVDLESIPLYWIADELEFDAANNISILMQFLRKFVLRYLYFLKPTTVLKTPILCFKSNLVTSFASSPSLHPRLSSVEEVNTFYHVEFLSPICIRIGFFLVRTSNRTRV